MAKISRVVGTVNEVLLVFIGDAQSKIGGGKTGLLFNTSLLTCYYKRNLDSASVAVVLVNISTLGSYISGGFKQVDATHMPGVYEFHPPNAALVTGADAVVFEFQGANNMVPLPLEIELTANNNQDGVRSGNSALPAAAAGATGGLPVVDSTGSVKLQTPVKRNTALSNFPFEMRDSSGNPVTGLTITAQRSLDGAAYGSCTNAATELSNGGYLINLSAADLNAICVRYRFSATGAKDTIVDLLTLP